VFTQELEVEKLKMFTGISDPFEAPTEPHIHIKDAEGELDDHVNKVLEYLQQNSYLAE